MVTHFAGYRQAALKAGCSFADGGGGRGTGGRGKGGVERQLRAILTTHANVWRKTNKQNNNKKEIDRQTRRQRRQADRQGD